MRGVFTGGHGKTMIDEMMRGSAGTMPAVPFADLYVLVWDAWRAGDRHKALDYFSKVSLMVTEATAYGLPGIKYMLRLRGVFENTKCRATSRNASFDEQAEVDRAGVRVRETAVQSVGRRFMAAWRGASLAQRKPMAAPLRRAGTVLISKVTALLTSES